MGADPTLHASICASARQVGDSSLALLSGAVSCEPSNSSKRSSAPQLSGSVWEACANLKKTPTSNCTAIGQVITHVAVLVNDVLREMNELKPTASTSSADASTEDNDSGVEDLGDDLSPEEMAIAQLATKAVSDVLVALEEIIHFVSFLLKSNNESMEHVEALERLLSCCQEIDTQVNEVGASVYPPQEFVRELGAMPHWEVDLCKKLRNTSKRKKKSYKQTNRYKWKPQDGKKPLPHPTIKIHYASKEIQGTYKVSQELSSAHKDSPPNPYMLAQSSHLRRPIYP